MLHSREPILVDLCRKLGQLSFGHQRRREAACWSETESWAGGGSPRMNSSTYFRPKPYELRTCQQCETCAWGSGSTHGGNSNLAFSFKAIGPAFSLQPDGVYSPRTPTSQPDRALLVSDCPFCTWVGNNEEGIFGYSPGRA